MILTGIGYREMENSQYSNSTTNKTWRIWPVHLCKIRTHSRDWNNKST